ncbi:MAG: hypothetical protein TREMPRED_000965 [Tremellales sp. Tagirdzhanova-0007]|nr:MAG: hypothetical protein TREMPRED_000965 [Tremellales sp. Tagirdzhanova-0007]
MASNDYKAVPTSSPSASPRASIDEPYRPLRASVQAEFDRPPPSWWKRAALILGVGVMLWATFKLGGMAVGPRGTGPKVIYASRSVLHHYHISTSPHLTLPSSMSLVFDEFKYRPAASPVITEYLKDGRIRLRGASVGGVGVREEDVPKSAAQKLAEERKRVEEAREAAKQRLGLKKRGRKGKDRKNKAEM